MLDAGVGHIPEDRQVRGLVLEFTIAENIALHDYAEPPDAKWGWLFPKRLVERARPDQGIRRSRRRPADARRRPFRRKPAEGRRGARDRARPEGADRGAADARARRRRDRVPAPAARRGARRGPRDPPRLARARRDPLPLRSHPRALRGRDRGRARCERLRGGDRSRDARRPERTPHEPRPSRARPATPEEAAATGRSRPASHCASARAGSSSRCSRRCSRSCSAASSCSPPATTRCSPTATSSTAPASTGSSTRRRAPSSTASYNLSQTLLQTTTLILTGLAVAFAFRCGMFNIGGQGQYFVGLYVANWVGLGFAGMAPLPHVLHRDRRRDARGRGLGGHRRLPQGDGRRARGDLDDHAQLDRDLGRLSTCSATAARCRTPTNAAVPISNDIADERAPAGLLGRRSSCRASHVGFFVAIAALVVFWLILNRTTLGYEVRAVGFNPEAAAYGGISVRKNLIRAMAISGAFAGLAGGARHARLPLPATAYPTSRSRRSASSASPSRCSAATPRSERASPRCSSARCSSARRTVSRRT